MPENLSSTRIVGFKTQIVSLRNQTLRTSYGNHVAERQHIFVSIQTECGVEGVGEGSPLPHFSGERASEMLAVIRDVLGPVLLGRNPFDTEGLSISLNRALPYHGASKAALMSAIYDLQGKLAGLPVCHLLGGRITEAIPVAGAVGIDTIDNVLAEVERLLALGIRTIKFKVGRDVNRDIAVLRAVRESFGSELELRADANAGFTYADALRFVAGVSSCSLQYLEQPLPSHDVHGLARLRRRTPFPIAADESLFSLESAMNLIRHEATDVFIIKLIKLNGLYTARKVVALAEAAGIPCVVVSPYETTLGVAANLHLAASSESFRYAAELGTGIAEVRLEGISSLQYADGYMQVPSSSGLGVGLPEGFFDAPLGKAAPA